MALRMTATNVFEIQKGLWSFEMPPHLIRHFGGIANSIGSRSVLVFSKYEYDVEAAELHFEADDVVAINVGTEQNVIALAAHLETNEKAARSSDQVTKQRVFGPGDRIFLTMTEKELPKSMQKAALALLTGIRSRSPGDLKKGLSRNFSDTPDNFWYVIIQPRVSQLSITVRGSVDHFRNLAKLPIKDDRGNTLFKITSENDVPSALEIIFHAKRKYL